MKMSTFLDRMHLNTTGGWPQKIFWNNGNIYLIQAYGMKKFSEERELLKESDHINSYTLSQPGIDAYGNIVVGDHGKWGEAISIVVLNSDLDTMCKTEIPDISSHAPYAVTILQDCSLAMVDYRARAIAVYKIGDKPLSSTPAAATPTQVSTVVSRTSDTPIASTSRPELTTVTPPIDGNYNFHSSTITTHFFVYFFVNI